MRWLLPSLVLSGLFASPAAAELPPSFRGWESRSVQTISLPQLATEKNAAIIREYGFLGAERREYTRQGNVLTVTLWRMEDATGSYGLYTFLSETGMTAASQGEDPGAMGPGVFLLQRGPYLLEARGDSLTPAEAAQLSGFVPKSTGREGLLPPLPGFLPAQGLVPLSAKYLIGPQAFSRVLDRIPASAIRFDMGAEAALAQYRMGQGAVKLLLVSYPTPQVAAKMLQEFQALPALMKPESGSTLFVQRKGTLVAFVLDAPTLASTEQLLSQVGYEMNVTWNEYVPPPGENAGSLMIAVFSLAGFVLLIAFFSGILFGGIRLVVKRFVPIPIFDRPSTIEIIRLNLSDM